MSRPLPSGWSLAKFDEVAHVATDLVSPADWPDLPHIAPDNIERHTGRLLTYRTIREDGVSSAKHRFRAGQLLYSKIRPYLNKCVLANMDGLCSADMYPIDALIDSKYLHQYMLTQRFVAEVAEAAGSRTVLPKTNREQLSGVSVIVAPLREQKRIAEATESYLSRLDDATATLERVQRNLTRYRASVLKAAVEGRLVPTEAELARAEGRSYEPASVLLGRILAERRSRWEKEQSQAKANGRGTRQYPAPELTELDSLPDLPEGWSWATLDMLAALKGGITKGQKTRPGEIYREVPYLRVANVQRGFLDLTTIKTIRATEVEIDELRLQVGDVLFNEGGDRDKLGRGWVWKGEVPECIHQNHVFRARLLTQDVIPEFVSWYGNTAGQQYFFDEGKHTTNLASINLTKLRGLPIPVPPCAEQWRIRAAVDDAISVADASLRTVNAQLRRGERLRQAILRWAFEGRLVDQAPTDEPASVLLDRIRAERAVVADKGARRRAGADRRSRRRGPEGESPE